MSEVPSTLEELLAAVEAIFEEAKQQAAGKISTFCAARRPETPQELRSPETAPMGRQEEESRHRRPSALYQLAQDAMTAFHAEHGRLPGVHELIEEMPAHDSDHFPVSPRLDAARGVIHWRTLEGKAKRTGLRSFENALTKIRRSVHDRITV